MGLLEKVGDAMIKSKQRRSKLQTKIGKVDPVMKKKEEFERENPIVPTEKAKPPPKPKVGTPTPTGRVARPKKTPIMRQRRSVGRFKSDPFNRRPASGYNRDPYNRRGE